MVARLRSAFPGLGRGRRFFTSSPDRTTRETAHWAPPPAGPHKGFRQPPSKPRSGPVPTPEQPGPSGNAFGERGGWGGIRRKKSAGLAARRGPWGSVGPGGQGPLERLRTWERPGPGRPLGAGGDLALGPWRRGRPGLAQRRRLQEARGFGLRRQLVPRPLSSPSSVRETAALRPAPSAAQAPAPAPTSTWGPIETVRHAPPPPPPPGAAAAALGRGRGGRRRGPALAAALTRASWRRRAAGLCSVPRRFGQSGRQLEHPPNPPLQSARPPRLPSAFRFSPKHGSPAFGAAGAKAGHSGPPRPGGPWRVLRVCCGPWRDGSRGPAGRSASGVPAAGQRCPPRGPGEGISAAPLLPGRRSRERRGVLTLGGPDLRGGSQERSARMTVDARKIKIRGEGAWRQSQGSRTRTSAGAQVCSMTRRRPAPGQPGRTAPREAPPPVRSAADGEGHHQNAPLSPPAPFNSQEVFIRVGPTYCVRASVFSLFSSRPERFRKCTTFQ